MFYTPWCGYWKSPMPRFLKAAENFVGNVMAALGAVSCAVHEKLCANYVRGFPTVNYFSYMDKKDYTDSRKKADFISFIHSQAGTYPTSQKEIAAQIAGFSDDVIVISDVEFERVINSRSPAFVMFYASWCSVCSQMKSEVSRLAVRLRQDESVVRVFAVDASENPKVADIAGIHTVPVFKLYCNGNLIATYDGDRTTSDMFEFCLIHHKDYKTA